MKNKTHKIWDISEYPKSENNKEKQVLSETFELVYGDEYLQRVYADGSGELVRYNDDTGMWTLIVCPAQAEESAEDKIRSSIRNNFDVGLCLKKQKEEMEAA